MQKASQVEFSKSSIPLQIPGCIPGSSLPQFNHLLQKPFPKTQIKSYGSLQKSPQAKSSNSLRILGALLASIPPRLPETTLPVRKLLILTLLDLLMEHLRLNSLNRFKCQAPSPSPHFNKSVAALKKCLSLRLLEVVRFQAFPSLCSFPLQLPSVW